MKTPPYSEGQFLQIASLSGTVPLHCQGGGTPAIGDAVRIGTGVGAVNDHPAQREPWYWCIGRNASGEYGAKITHSDLVPSGDALDELRAIRESAMDYMEESRSWTQPTKLKWNDAGNFTLMREALPTMEL